MLYVLPGWWMAFMEWLDHSTVPVMLALIGVTVYFLYAFWRDVRIISKEHKEIHDGPSSHR